MIFYELRDAIASCRKCIFVDKPFCKFRVYERYLPKEVRVLVISESPPPGNKEDFLYNLNHFDRLRNTLAKIFNINPDEVVEYLIRHKVFWTTAVKCRPCSKKDLEYMRRNCLDILRMEIMLLKPKKIVALGNTAKKSIRDLNLAGFHIEEDYHPLYIIRFQRNRLSSLKNKIIDPT